MNKYLVIISLLLCLFNYLTMFFLLFDGNKVSVTRTFSQDDSLTECQKRKKRLIERACIEMSYDDQADFYGSVAVYDESCVDGGNGDHFPNIEDVQCK